MLAVGIPSTIQTASIGIPDTLLLMLLALVVFGPRRLPEIGRQIGKLMYEFRKVSNEFKYQMEEELRASEDAERQKKLQAITPLPAAPPVQPVLQTTPDSASIQEIVSTDGIGQTPDQPQVPIAETVEQPVREVPGEVMGSYANAPIARDSSYPQIQPPSTGESIPASRPFRSRPDVLTETVTESGSEPEHNVSTPAVVEDEGSIGSEVQPGVTSGSERGTNHV
jgi:sec-independent protein translocase protein TatB